MKRLLPVLALIFGWTWAAAAYAAAESGPLSNLRAIDALSSDAAQRALPADFEATVTFYRPYEHILFVQNDDMAIFVYPIPGLKVDFGDRVLVRGYTQASFRPIVIAESITLLRHDAAIQPVSTGLEELIRGQYDSLLVTVHAQVHAADIVLSIGTLTRSARLQLLADGGHFEANVNTDDETALKGLLDDEIEITGIAAGKFDNKMQRTGVVLYARSLDAVKILNRPSASPWSLLPTPMDQVYSVSDLSNRTPRVRVQGTITYYQPGAALVLQSGSKSLWIATHTREPLQIGDLADAIGFPEARDRTLTLTDAEILDRHIQAPVAPQPATWNQLGFWSTALSNGHQNDLVSIEGVVVAQVREAAQDEYILDSGGRLFTAIYRHPYESAGLPPMPAIPYGSRIRATGICVIEDVNAIYPGEEVPFNILLRTFGDITVVANPSLLNVRNLILLVGLLLAIVIVVGARGWLLERKVRRQTAAMAARIETVADLERRRSRILEDINGSRPLAGILEDAMELLSYMLHGAPCWCQVSDGARLGTYPHETQDLRILHEEIPARSGPPAGEIFAGLDPLSKPCPEESEALAMTVGLAALAIESRRIFSDLLYRSEFDLLTDIHNRFSLDKYLDAQIEEARSKAHIFGLIYIDLDEFKQVNDLYGHKIGDLYLQEVALRMKRQLRSHDMLARIGGDEFAVLLAVVRSRADVEEIALRLERCFDDPFSAEGYTLHGSASVGIALYPEDSTTKDGLLNAADAAMYVAKHTKRQGPLGPPPSRFTTFTPRKRT